MTFSHLRRGRKLKKYLVLVICGFLLVGPVAAFTPEQIVESSSRADKLLREAESRAMEQCDTTRIVVPLLRIVPGLDLGTYTERTVDTTVSIEWSGACVDGKRDGVGVLNWIEEREEKTRFIVDWRSEGRFVKGQRLGLWCMTSKIQMTRGSVIREISDSGCSVIAGHTKPLTANYRKQSDGKWKEYTANKPSDIALPLAAGTLEAQSAKVIADALAGKTDLKVELVVVAQSSILDDLVRGSKIVVAPGSKPISLKDKNVALVLSSGMVTELERFKRERQAFIAASGGMSGEGAKLRAEFIAASDPQRLLVNIAKVLRKHAKTVQPADDLVGLQKGRFDYALIVDWKSLTRFDQLGKFDNFPRSSGKKSGHDEWNAGAPAIAVETMQGFLVNRDLKAIKIFIASPANVILKSSVRTAGIGFTGDNDYMDYLAIYFKSGWGEGADDIGKVLFDLDHFAGKN